MTFDRDLHRCYLSASSLLLVPLVRPLAHLLGIVDHPDSERKLHAKPVALGGGLAVFLALVAAFVGNDPDRSRSSSPARSGYSHTLVCPVLVPPARCCWSAWSMMRGRCEVARNCLLQCSDHRRARRQRHGDPTDQPAGIRSRAGGFRLPGDRAVAADCRQCAELDRRCRRDGDNGRLHHLSGPRIS